MAELYPWQEKLLIDIESGRVKPGEMTIMMAGRGTGKSKVVAYQRLWQDIFEANSKVSDLILEEGTIFGSRYYTVQPVDGNWFDMEVWCTRTFGDVSSIWETTHSGLGRWYMNDRKFWFKEEKDRDWFVIRWNS